jgi:hypothetical protein
MMEAMRRLFWMGVGAAAGASGTVWAQRRVRAGLDELDAGQVVAVAGRGARSLGRTLAAAVAEGRSGMAEREMELRRQMEGTGQVLDLRAGGSARGTAASRRWGAAPAASGRRPGR